MLIRSVKKSTIINNKNSVLKLIMASQEFKSLQNFMLLKHKLMDLLVNSTYDQICQYYKRVCFQLMYLLNTLKFILPSSNLLKEHFSECIKTVETLVESTQYQKFGHKLPLFKLVIQKYQLISCKDKIVSQENKQKRVLKNEQSQHYKSLTCPEISCQQIAFIKVKSNLIRFLNDLNTNQQILNNPQCICCSRVFLYKSILSNNNPLIPIVKDISKKKALDRIYMEKNITAICNGGGGALILGVQKRDDFFVVTGLRYRNQNQLKSIQQQIKASLANIKPSCQCLIQRVFVHANFQECGNQITEFMRICFRILIFPQATHLMSYLEIYKKGCQTIYETHKLQKSWQITQVMSQKLYKQIHKKYNKVSRIRTNAHQNIKCFKPYQNCSKKFMNFFNQNQGNLHKLMIEQIQEPTQQQTVYKDSPSLRYENISLIIVGTSNQDYYINNFTQYLHQIKQTFDINRLYHESFPECTRSVWVISHQKCHTKLRNLLKNFTQRLSIKAEAITMMPVFTSLQVLAEKYTNYIEQTLSRKLSERFKDFEGFTKKYQQYFDYKKHDFRKLVYLNFKDIKQSMYAYMIFENMQIKPYFHSEQQNPKM